MATNSDQLQKATVMSEPLCPSDQSQPTKQEALDGDSTDLPREIVDAHHHFFDTTNNAFSRGFLGTLLKDSYLPSQYQRDVVERFQQAGVKLLCSVHIEAMADDGLEEALWIQNLESTVASIVAGCDLTKPDVDLKLRELTDNCKRVKGIRWILDCDGVFGSGSTATHVGNLRHNGIDYLRGSNGGYDGECMPEFERGFSLLAKYGLSFDLQCAPVQLKAAARLCSRHRDIMVCIEHFGKPRKVFDNDLEGLNTVELDIWREGMKNMAALPHVYVKISMLGYAVPNWFNNLERKKVLKGLIEEVVDMFGTDRCMIGLNWWKDAATSDADGFSDVGPDPAQFVRCMSDFFLSKYSDQDRRKIFVDNALDFYKIESVDD